jgi:hypothetical protein
VRQNSSTAAGDVGRAAVGQNSAIRRKRLISSTTAPLFAAATSAPCALHASSLDTLRCERDADRDEETEHQQEHDLAR